MNYLYFQALLTVCFVKHSDPRLGGGVLNFHTIIAQRDAKVRMGLTRTRTREDGLGRAYGG